MWSVRIGLEHSVRMLVWGFLVSPILIFKKYLLANHMKENENVCLNFLYFSNIFFIFLTVLEF